MARVLLIADQREECELIELLLGRAGIEVVSVQAPRSALERIVEERFDAVLTDLDAPGMDGIELCERAIGARPDIPLVVFTGSGNIDLAVRAMHAGAIDFLTKPVDGQLLLVAVRRAIERRRLVRELERLRVAVTTANDEDGILGRSAAMRRALALVRRVAPSEASVVIHGETGTGKELVARAIHRQSARAEGPFVAVNCATMQPNLIESELFGHVRGAFTDARDNKKGLFLEATGGTLFLDEVGELPLEMQPKLLRALQERTIRPVGSDKEIPYDARFVCATNRVLEDEVFEGRFREDLYYRLNVVRIDVPALRERDADVPFLARHFLDRFATQQGRTPYTLTAEATVKLVAYPWPGNVREIENAMERAVALCGSREVSESDLPQKIREYRSTPFTVAADREEDIVTVEELGRRYTMRVLSVLNGNKARAAQALGIDRRTLYRKLADWACAAKTAEAPPRGP